MSKQARCGPEDAKRRLKTARLYLEVAELAVDESAPESLNVAAGNAVLAAIAASDALCCLRLGRMHRGADHHEAMALLQTVEPGGKGLSADLAKVLAVKDQSHYGTVFMTATKLKTTLRSAAKLVDAAGEAVERA